MPFLIGLVKERMDFRGGKAEMIEARKRSWYEARRINAEDWAICVSSGPHYSLPRSARQADAAAGVKAEILSQM